MKTFVPLLICLCLATPAAAQMHPCSADAVAQARKLIRFHLADAAMEPQIADGTQAKRVADSPALGRNGKLEVLEVGTDVYKARYRMRFLYAPIPGSCALLGQEILEAAAP